MTVETFLGLIKNDPHRDRLTPDDYRDLAVRLAPLLGISAADPEKLLEELETVGLLIGEIARKAGSP